MSRTALAAVAAMGAAFGGPLLAQAPVDEFHVQGNVHMLVGAGANVVVQVGEEGVLVVDTGVAADREAVLVAIRRLSDKPIRWIVNTSAGSDHTGGNETVSQAGISCRTRTCSRA
jgi:glyoxylase-like metal-dependent hydrolase (beta-lactamase superfamily II)